MICKIIKIEFFQIATFEELSKYQFYKSKRGVLKEEIKESSVKIKDVTLVAFKLSIKHSEERSICKTSHKDVSRSSSHWHPPRNENNNKNAKKHV